MGLSVTSHGSWRMTCLSPAWVFSSLGRVPLSLSGTWTPSYILAVSSGSCAVCPREHWTWLNPGGFSLLHTGIVGIEGAHPLN